MVGYRIAVMALFLFMPTAWAVPPLYHVIAERESVPPQALYALAMTESATLLGNGQVRPWPWTLNVEGQPYRYPSKAQACQALKHFLMRTKVVDIGLLQINWRWHSAPFSKPCDVLVPETNLTYAAKLLYRAYLRLGDWTKAAGYYHRPAGGTPAKRYQQKFSEHYAQTIITFQGGNL
ncbi:transglycosylase SLT domain-containing protein [Vibrio pectenicida]|uniref:Uncharacterized protein n=1 Tax=Vibrio pectenicida TaxID=62763 RepID=A0A3R9G444_9VIBR|nr:transglycosylase SLT domain-containing protein [Vibrio pectenicida]RSD31728.1 hypothetical protein EJA03_07320 [Vibrio pectenicida]